MLDQNSKKVLQVSVPTYYTWTWLAGASGLRGTLWTRQRLARKGQIQIAHTWRYAQEKDCVRMGPFDTAVCTEKRAYLQGQ